MQSSGKLKLVLLATLMCVPFTIYSDESLMGDVGDVIRGTGQGIEHITNKVGNVVGGTSSNSSTTNSDAQVTDQVKAKLAAQPDLPTNISVTTTNGTVYLEGSVSSQSQADKIVALTNSVAGVKAVDSTKLTVSR